MGFKKAGIAAIGVAALVLLLFATFRMEWSVDLDTGLQTYERSIAGVAIRPWSEYAYQECDRWQNPLPDQEGRKLLSSCSLFLGCEESDVDTAVIREGCALGAKSDAP